MSRKGLCRRDRDRGRAFSKYPVNGGRLSEVVVDRGRGVGVDRVHFRGEREASLMAASMARARPEPVRSGFTIPVASADAPYPAIVPKTLAPRLRAEERRSRTTNAAPSPRRKPLRRRSKGRIASVVRSLRAEKPLATKRESASAPPARRRSALPSRIIRKARPMAVVPDAQAVLTVRFTGESRKRRATARAADSGAALHGRSASVEADDRVLERKVSPNGFPRDGPEDDAGPHSPERVRGRGPGFHRGEERELLDSVERWEGFVGGTSREVKRRGRRDGIVGEIGDFAAQEDAVREGEPRCVERPDGTDPRLSGEEAVRERFDSNPGGTGDPHSRDDDRLPFHSSGPPGDGRRKLTRPNVPRRRVTGDTFHARTAGTPGSLSMSAAPAASWRPPISSNASPTSGRTPRVRSGEGTIGDSSSVHSRLSEPEGRTKSEKGEGEGEREKGEDRNSRQGLFGSLRSL